MRSSFDEGLQHWEVGDTASAFRAWKAAAEHGDDSAQLQLGLCCELGLETEIDYTSAFRYYQQSAEAGNPDAQFSLGTLYRDGRGVARDYARALELFRASAARGVTKSHTALGSMIRAGMGTSQDLVEACGWYRAAAHRGDRDAQFMLGVIYLNGEGIPANSELAAGWFRKAAEADDAEAQFNLGIMYYRGEGVPRDIVTCHKWLNLSKIGGYERAEEFLNAVASDMSREELACAISMAQETATRTNWDIMGTHPRDDQKLQRRSRKGEEVELALKVALGDEVYASLDATTRAYLIKAELDYSSLGDRSEISSSFLMSKAFENEFNIRVRDVLIHELTLRGYLQYPAQGDYRLVKGGVGNDRLTPGQVLRFVKEDLFLQGLLLRLGMDPESLAHACEPLLALRNQLVHEEFTIEDARAFRSRVLGTRFNVFACLRSGKHSD